jgi:hypothetical protein
MCFEYAPDSLGNIRLGQNFTNEPAYQNVVLNTAVRRFVEQTLSQKTF